jgi:hypothetical protein
MDVIILHLREYKTGTFQGMIHAQQTYAYDSYVQSTALVPLNHDFH